MLEYQAPLTDMKFVLRELVDLDLLAQLPGFSDMTLDVADAVLDEAAKFAGGVLSPINRSGDLEGVRWQEGRVLTAAGWVNSSKGTPLAVTPVKWKRYVPDRRKQ